MKTTFKLAISLLAVLISIILVGCDTTKPATLNESDIYNFSVLTGTELNMINDSQIAQSALFSDTTETPELPVADEPAPIEPETDLENINHYTNLFETFLSDPIKVSDPVESNLVDDLGDPLYQYMITYEVKNALGETDTYVFHYTQVDVTNEDDTLDDNTDEDETLDALEIDDTSDEIDETLDPSTTLISKITGIMIKGDITYEVFGRKVIETSNEENEISYVFTTKKDDQTFVRVKYQKETNNGEVEEKFFIFEHSKGLVNRTMIKIEAEDDGYNYMIHYQDKVTGEFKMFMIKTSSNPLYDYVIFYKTRNDDENLTGRILVKVVTDELTGEITYEYESLLNPGRPDNDPEDHMNDEAKEHIGNGRRHND